MFARYSFFIVCIQLCALWLFLSLVTSGIKVVKDECKKTYVIEKVVEGKLFCPEK